MSDYNYIHAAGFLPELILTIPFVVVFIWYMIAVILSNRRYKKWPIHRTLFFILGFICAVATFNGPLANDAHEDFTRHMLGHLLLGMLSPLFIVLAAPMTLMMRTLNVRAARRLTRFLRGWQIHFLTNPIVASILNIGGLWLLYTTDLYIMMKQNMLLHVFVHLHVFLAGYVFTASILYIDPISHRLSYIYRAIVFVIALAGHGILSKYIYAHPPSGVPSNQAELGGMIMYYGGDVIDLAIIFIFCYQWYKSTAPKESMSVGQ